MQQAVNIKSSKHGKNREILQIDIPAVYFSNSSSLGTAEGSSAIATSNSSKEKMLLAAQY
eukprot:scaffold365372_cov36-Prasinocladus_malaysianus.AAC.1